MTDRETIFHNILALSNILESHLVTGRDKSLRNDLYTIDVEAASCLDIVYCHRHIISGVYLYEFCHDYAITDLTAARMPSF